MYGDATFVPRTGAGADTLGANKNFFLDVKIPGKTGWMDAAQKLQNGRSVEDLVNEEFRDLYQDNFLHVRIILN